MYLIKNKSGLYSPMDESDFEDSKKIKVGDVVKATGARNWQFHKKAFALLNLGFENQDKIKLFELYRKVITIRAGYFSECEIGKEREAIPIAESLSYAEMSSEKLNKFYDAVLMVVSGDLETKPETIQAEINSFF